MAKVIELFTDGSAIGNPGPGGYGIVLKAETAQGLKIKEFSEGFKETTNNRMELMAVIEGLKKLKSFDWDVHIYSDSKYVVDAINQGWLDKWVAKGFAKVKNPDLWLTFHALQKKFKLKFTWVKGHAGHPENERCDQLAVAAAKQPVEKLHEDTGYISQKDSLGLSD